MPSSKNSGESRYDVHSSAKCLERGVEAPISCSEVGRLLGDDDERLDGADVGLVIMSSVGTLGGASRTIGSRERVIDGDRVDGEMVDSPSVGRLLGCVEMLDTGLEANLVKWKESG